MLKVNLRGRTGITLCNALSPSRKVDFQSSTRALDHTDDDIRFVSTPSSMSLPSLSLSLPSSLSPSSVNYVEVIKRDNMYSSDRLSRKLVSQNEASFARATFPVRLHDVRFLKDDGLVTPRNRDLSLRSSIKPRHFSYALYACVAFVVVHRRRTPRPAMIGMQ